MLLLYSLREPSYPHSPTHSTIQYKVIHPSPCALQPPKYHIWSMRKAYLKTRMECMILFTIYDLFTMNVYDRDGRKNQKKKTKNETKEKIFPVWLPSHSPATKWRPTVFQCPKTPKTSRTYLGGGRDPSLMGEKQYKITLLQLTLLFFLRPCMQISESLKKKLEPRMRFDEIANGCFNWAS